MVHRPPREITPFRLPNVTCVQYWLLRRNFPFAYICGCDFTLDEFELLANKVHADIDESSLLQHVHVLLRYLITRHHVKYRLFILELNRILDRFLTVLFFDNCKVLQFPIGADELYLFLFFGRVLKVIH